jgi:amino acid adenylation domain-containing protein/non-ribosomal peptide synthase protein (TIGR01720 family)
MDRIIKTNYPLSYGQRAMWFIYEMAPESVAYNIFITAKINSYLNLTAFRRVWSKIFERNSILRTTYTTHEGKPVQQIHEQNKLNIENIQIIDASNWSEDYLKSQIFAIADSPFNLEKDSAFRVNLFTRSVKEHVLLLTMHHIASDMWSCDLLLSEFQALYATEIESASQQQTEKTPDSSIENKSYLGFVHWQSEMLSSARGEKLWQYWQKQLAGELPILNLLTDKPRPTVQTYQGSSHISQLDEQLIKKLKNLALASRTSLYQILLTAFYVLLYRYTNQQDILVGSPMRGRWGKEFKEIVGYFVNPIVLRVSVKENATFNELLAQVSKTVREAQKHQDYPFSLLTQRLQQQRDPSRPPLYQVSFTWQAQRWCKTIENSRHVQEQVLQMEPYLIGQRGAHLDLSLMVRETQGDLELCWQYNTDLFEATTITCMARHFVTLLEGIAANPIQQISQLPLLSEIEQQQLLVEWNNTQADYPQDKCIHQLFEEQVARTPDAVAVVYENQQLTYQQLNGRANQLAHYLQTLGVGPDVLVGLCVERSLHTIVGLLGILKAGGAYLPLDPEYPQERLSFMLADTQAKVLLTQHPLAEKLGKHEIPVIYLDSDWHSIAQLDEKNLENTTTPKNLVYVIFTSGSTGRAKGVAIEHKQLLNYLHGIQEKLFWERGGKFALVSTFAADLGNTVIFPCLASGGCLHVLSEARISDSNAFLEYCQQHPFDYLKIVPSHLEALLSSVQSETRLPWRRLILGGEATSWNLVEKLLIHAPQCQIFNHYGPTETTVGVLTFKVESQPVYDTKFDTFSLTQIIPLGRPLSNTQIYLLDRDLQPVPVGVPGELHIGGACLARGYLNHPELTQEKFIPNPFSTDPHSRLYKTGDLARYLPDGNIEYLGRIDNQVKIRGFRIELGEIEAVLSQYPHVQTSCVIAREDNPGIKRLVAYLVPHPQVTPTTSELRQFLKATLPEYMIPSAFVILEALPLTRNGKVDRRALPAPYLQEGLEVSFVAPRTPEEEILAQIWSQVLRVKQVGIHDNFFELGGDSILNIQIITRARQAGLLLIPKQLFAHQTIAELAAVAGTTKVAHIEQGLVTGAVPLTPIQLRFFEQKSPEKHHYNQSFLLSVPSDLKIELLEQVWQQLLVHQDALRLRFTQSDDRWQQNYSAPSDRPTVSFVDLSTLPESEQQAVIEATATSLQASLHLAENLVQVAYFWFGIDKRARLLIIIHHLVVDGVSWRILLEDLQTAHQQLCQGQAIQLPAKTTSFQDWAQHLIEYAQSDVLKSELPHWLSASDASISPIPVDYTGGVNTVASASTVSVSLNEAQTQALLQDVPKAYKTQINDVLLTALVLVLSRWTNSESVLFNLEGHGRENIADGVDLSRTVGWFTTIFPVVLKIAAIDKDNIGNALKSVKEQLRAIPNKGIGYGLLRYLSQEPEIITQFKILPQAEISFNDLGQFTQVLNQSSMMQLASESSGQNHSLDHQRPHLLDINAIITNERLQIDWTYSRNFHQPRTIEKIAQEFVEQLQDLIDHCLSSENGGYTPTDFPLLQLNQLELDQIFANL